MSFVERCFGWIGNLLILVLLEEFWDGLCSLTDGDKAKDSNLAKRYEKLYGRA